MVAMGPLARRIPRQLRNNLGKYLGIFALIAFAVAFVSGFLTATSSLTLMADQMTDRYRLEDGRLVVSHELSARQVEAAERGEFPWFDRVALAFSGDKADLTGYEPLTLYELFSREATMTVPDDAIQATSPITLRVFKNREDIDLASLHEGRLPQAADEVAIDPTFARNHGIAVGATINVAGRALKVTGIATLPDYTTSLRKNTDFIMDALTFCVGVMTPEGYDTLSDCPQTCTYGFVFDDQGMSRAQRTTAEGKLARALALAGADVTDLTDVDSNQGVNYATDDFAGDSTMFRVAFYLIMAIMAFIFVVVTSATIEAESPVIGTLLASGYGKGELVFHYLTLPTLVAIVAVIVGNLAQPIFLNWTLRQYYNSYSLPPFEYHQDWGVLVQTSVVPVAMLVAITCLGLARRLSHTPLAFLRHETSGARRGGGVHLPEGLPFLARLRLRVLLSNVGSVVIIFLGIFFSGAILVFGTGMLPVIDNYAVKLADSLPAQHVYALRSQVDLPDQDAGVANQAERVELQSLEAPKKWDSGPMGITVYGMDEDSIHWPQVASELAAAQDGSVVIGAGLAQKCALATGDTLTLHNPFRDEDYALTVAGVTDDDTDTNAYLPRPALNDLVGNDRDDFNGWVSDADLHFCADDIATDLTPADMARIAGQMRSSMGNIMQSLVFAAAVIFVIVIYLLSKTVMERSSHAMSQLKVFGYRNGELSRVYVRAITVSVVVALLVSVPLLQAFCAVLFDVALLDYDIALRLVIPWTVFARYLATGLACYAAVALLNRRHLGHVPLALALKAQE